jgi:hypothetical protein
MGEIWDGCIIRGVVEMNPSKNFEKFEKKA